MPGKVQKHQDLYRILETPDFPSQLGWFLTRNVIITKPLIVPSFVTKVTEYLCSGWFFGTINAPFI